MLNETCKLIFENDFLEFAIPSFIKIQIGNLSCQTINFLKWIFEIESTEMGYAIIGVKVFIPIILLIIGGLFSYFKSNSHLKRAVRSYVKKR